MCYPSWETHIPGDMCSPTWETEIPSDICFPTWETHIPSDMWYELMWCLTRFYQLNKCRCRCVPLPGKHISLVICFFLPRKHISLVICVPLPGKHLSLVICVPLPGKHISLVICFFLPRKHISLVICVPLLGKHVSLVICVPLLMLWEVFPQGMASFFFFCFKFLIEQFVLWFAFNFAASRFQSESLHASAKVSLRCYHVWQLLLTWIELFILIVICLPLPAPPGNTGWLLSLILRLLKIFLRTLDWRRWILAGIFNEILFTLFTWCPLASFVIIFPICFDLGDFLYPEFPTDQENNHTGSKKDTKLIRYGIFYWKFLQVFIFLNLLPEFPYKSFMLTAILRIMQPHVLSYWALATGGCLWSWLWVMAAKTQLWRWLINFSAVKWNGYEACYTCKCYLRP